LDIQDSDDEKPKKSPNKNAEEFEDSKRSDEELLNARKISMMDKILDTLTFNGSTNQISITNSPQVCDDLMKLWNDLKIDRKNHQ
jgi:hypothetical protein